jgi:hypothetical protein
MAQPTLDDPEFDEFNAWARWVADRENLAYPSDTPPEWSAGGCEREAS